MNERTASRREFIKILAITSGIILPASDILISHQTVNEGVTRLFWEHLETQSLTVPIPRLIDHIHERFGVVILPGDDPIEIANRMNTSPEFVRATTSLRSDWDGPRLMAVANTLEILPRRFYSPRIYQPEMPLQFSLYENFTPGRAMGQYNAFSHEMMLSKKWLPQTLNHQLNSKRLIVHELTHSFTANGFQDMSSSDFEDNESKLKASLGLSDIRSLRNVFREVIVESENDPRLKSWSTHIGYGATNFGEFWAVAAEYYILGKTAFVDSYRQFFSEPSAHAFYLAMKEELFNQFEYENGQRIS